MVEDQERVDGGGDEEAVVSKRFIAFLFLGFALVVAGIIVMIVAGGIGGGSASFSGVIFIGPFPIVFGAGPDWYWLAAISIGITALSIVVLVIMRKRT
jgi:uncharacterized membrane protein